MRTVGQTLKEAREEKLLTLEDVEKATKIRKELLAALESDDYNKLPPSTFVQGFIKNYAKYLGLNNDKLLAIFRREFAEEKHPPKVMDAFVSPPKDKKYLVTPARVIGLVISLIVITFFVYLWFQYRQFVGAPSLTVVSPTDQLTTDKSIIVVEGKTDPEVRILVNGQEVTTDSDGEFKEELTLTTPVNKISIDAVSKFGRKNQVERTVYLER